jgi:hypothetical protein
MRSVKTFNEENVDAMIDYLIFVSTPSDRGSVTHTVLPTPSSTYLNCTPLHLGAASYMRASTPEFQILTALQARLPAMPALQRESLPVLPYMTDEARDLAAIASAVVRNAHTVREPRRVVRPEVGPMNEGFEVSDDEGVGVSNVDAGDEQKNDATEGTEEGQSEMQQDVIRFIKACFDVQAEAMRRVAPPAAGAGLVKKHPRRRRRRDKPEDKPRPEERLSLGTSTPSVEEGSVDGREFGQMLSSGTLPAAGTGAGGGLEYMAPGSNIVGTLPVDTNAKPNIVRQPSQDTKKRKGMFRFMSSSRK